MSDIRQWLEELGLGQYADAFDAGAIGLELLPELDHNVLKDLGVSVPGHRLKILKAARGEGPDPPQSDADLPEEDETVDTKDVRTTSEAERRQLTVMFCDLVGSTALSEKLDPEDLREVMAAYQRAAGAVVERYDGHVAQYLGDGLMTYFGWPKAHEDDAQRAVRAGLEIVTAVQSIEAPMPLSVRVGISTGPVVVGETGAGDAAVPKAAVGETPNVAARVQGLAEPDTVTIGEATRRLIAGAFDLEDLGAQDLKGVTAPVQVYRVMGESDVESRFDASHGAGLTPLVGRDEEVGLLLKRWEQAKDGEGQVVLLSGEAGIGKSRITQTLRERIGDEPHTRLRYQCSPYNTNSAFYPMIGQLERAAGFARNDDTDTKLDNLEALLAQPAENVTDIAPLFAAMLSLSLDRYPPLNLSPQKQKENTIAALADQVALLAGRQPVLMIFEDVHWIDPTSLDALDAIVTRIHEAPVLLVITFRPEFDPPWTGHSHITALTLNRLSRRQGADMVAKVTGGKALPNEVLDQIVAKTDGVPLFVEELTKMVLEADLLKETGGGYAIDGPLPPLAIPATLQDSLMARLDRLIAAKDVAQIGACIGREFSHTLITIVAPLGDEELSDALQQLVKSELVFRIGTPPSATYTFKHALVQDAAYNSLLKSRRQQLHQSIADGLLANDPTIAQNGPELLAHHFTAAESHSSAVKHWLAAGVRAAARFGHEEAINHLLCGFAVVEKLADPVDRAGQEHALLMALVRSYRILGRYEEALEALERAEGPAAREERARDLAEINYLRGSIYFPLGDFAACRKAHQDALSCAHASESLEYEARAYSGLADAHYLHGEIIEAFRHFDRCVVLAQEHGLGEIEASNLHMRGLCHYYQNRISKSIEDCLRGIELAPRHGQYRAEVSARNSIILPLWDAGDLSGVIAHAEAGIEVAKRTGARTFEPFGLMYHARALAASGDRGRALALAREAAAIALETGPLFSGPWALGNLAFVTNDPEEREDALTQGDEIIRSNCVGHCVWWFHRDAIETCLMGEQWDRADHYANNLEAYTADEPLPWCTYFIDRGRALAAWGRGSRDDRVRLRLKRICKESKHCGFATPKLAIDRALACA